VHRDLEITVSPPATDGLIEDLVQLDGVITLSVRRGESVKPPGDVISVAVLNRDAEAVQRRVQAQLDHGPISISTSELDSLIDPEQAEQIRSDVDEATWSDAETTMRHHTRPTFNFFTTTAAGGVATLCALVSTSGVTEATALVAGAIIAPAFEPLARIGLTAVKLRWRELTFALGTTLLTFAILVASALLTMLVLRAGRNDVVGHFLTNGTVHEVQHPPAVNLIISACGAIAGVVMVAAGRFTVLAGPVVALQLLPAAATIGAGIELGDGGIAARGLGRLAIDFGLVVVAGLVVFSSKHVRGHGRRKD
jgi:uncharacterized membrane protein